MGGFQAFKVFASLEGLPPRRKGVKPLQPSPEIQESHSQLEGLCQILFLGEVEVVGYRWLEADIPRQEMRGFLEEALSQLVHLLVG